MNLKKMSRIRTIIQSFFEHTMPREIQDKFFHWLVQPKDKEEKELYMSELWDNLEISADTTTVKAFEQNPIGRQIKQRKILLKISRIAAIICLPILSFALSYLYFTHKDHTEQKMIECFVPRGEIQTIYLSDSTRVQLNSGTILIYPEKFTGKTREVYLSGEALFAVKRDEKKPFKVKTADMRIEVLGTIFNVNSYPENNLTETTLQEGRVRILLNDLSTAPIILSKNEQFSYDKTCRKSEKRKVDVEDVLVWTNGGFILKNKKIEDIVALIERKYNVRVFLNSDKYNRTNITAKFTQDQTLEEYLYVLKQIIPQFKYKRQDNIIYIY